MQNKSDSPLCTLFGIGCSNGVAFNSPDTSFGNGTNANRESAAVDAHYGGATTFDYFKNVHGRNGIFGNGAGAPSRVHYGNNYVNAFWDGSKMTYGDGDGVEFGPLVSLDVAGHEMSHGVTENTAGLTYSGESGGTQRGDLGHLRHHGGVLRRQRQRPWRLLHRRGVRPRERPGLPADGQPVARTGSSLNCWTSNAGATRTSTTPRASATTSSTCWPKGSGSKEIGGRTHSSPTCNGLRRSPASAATTPPTIWFRALDVYMTSGTNYAQARTATLNAAARPLRREQRAAQRRGRRLECRQRRLTFPSRKRAGPHRTDPGGPLGVVVRSAAAAPRRPPSRRPRPGTARAAAAARRRPPRAAARASSTSGLVRW